MRKLKLMKAKVLEHVEAYHPSLLSTTEEVSKEACLYRLEQVLSDTPMDTTPDSYPYRIINGVVELHQVFRLLFPNGKVPTMTKVQADNLFATKIGFDKRSGCACRIFRNEEEINIVVYPPNDEPYTMDCFTGLKKEEKK